MKKKFNLIALCISIIITGTIIYIKEGKSEGYDLKETKEDIMVTGTLLEGNKYLFTTRVNLGKDIPISYSMMEIKLYTEIEYDDKEIDYVLKNTDMEVIPIGCKEKAFGGKYTGKREFKMNYEVATKSNEIYSETMAVGFAKNLLKNENIKINKITAVNSYSKIDSINDLKRTKNNNLMVAVEYSTLEQYFSQWYNIKFRLTSKNEGTFSVN
ncbi:hypothetical protein SAMN05444401_3817 [Clostridium amylolyticum]|uniref:Uncharacterized protein n=1 Tax=Clostridium amylolyticum TaxID=1121298 RepID=A0A1M6LXA1_9CLOT|nr:hypothetical protein [Clostridium amylolyticum]SHJ75775.1 hypothetical protein SAMN05444401_3817 [Clostridium amylolyticum]